MNPRDLLAGLGAFAAGSAALVSAVVLGDAYLARRIELGPEPEAEAEPQTPLLEAPHVAEDRDGPVATSPAAVIQGSAGNSSGSPEHIPVDLMGDTPPTAATRAPDAFRPDPTAPVPPEMRESLRPATGPAPSLIADRGDSIG